MTADPPPPRRKWHFTRWLTVLIIAMFGWSGWRAYAYRSALAEAKALGWYVQYTDPVETIRKNWMAAFEKATWWDGVTQLNIPTSKAFEQHLSIVYRLNPKRLQIDNAATLRDLSALKPLSRLQTVRLAACTGLTNLDALKDFSALEEVWLSDCPGLINVDALKNVSALQRVWLIVCTGLTNVDGLKNLPALQYVSLSDCSGLRNLDAFKNLTPLQVLDLNGCTGLTNVDGLKDLSALQYVDLRGCTGLTPETVAALKAALPAANMFSDYQ